MWKVQHTPLQDAAAAFVPRASCAAQSARRPAWESLALRRLVEGSTLSGRRYHAGCYQGAVVVQEAHRVGERLAAENARQGLLTGSGVRVPLVLLQHFPAREGLPTCTAAVRLHARPEGGRGRDAAELHDRIRVRPLVGRQVAGLGKRALADVAAVQLRNALLLVRLPVSAQVGWVGEAPVADVALKGLLPLVDLRMGEQVVLAGEALLAHRALDGPPAHLTLGVPRQVLFAREAALADAAGVRKLARVALPVQVQLPLAREALLAEVARVGAPLGVAPLVGVSLLLRAKVLPAEAAEVGALVGRLHCAEDEAGVLGPASGSAESQGEGLFHVDPLVILGVLPAVGRESAVGAAVQLLGPFRQLHGVLDLPVPVGAVSLEEELAAHLARGTHGSKVDLDLWNRSVCLAAHTLPSDILALYILVGSTDGHPCSYSSRADCSPQTGVTGSGVHWRLLGSHAFAL